VVLPALGRAGLVTSSPSPRPGRRRTARTIASASDSLLDALFTLWLVASRRRGVLLVYGLTQRKAIAQQMASGRYRRTISAPGLASRARAHSRSSRTSAAAARDLG
jgi:hypothetical protein